MADETRTGRREFLRHAAAASAVLGAAAGMAGAAEPEGEPKQPAAALKGRIKHSVSKWCFGRLSVEELAKQCVRIGIKSIELVGPGDWPTLKKYNLVCAMCPTHGIDPGLNRRENHTSCLASIRNMIEEAEKFGFPNVIALSGNRKGMADEEGLKNCVEGLKQVAGLAEEKKITICMELLNSKVDHRDYMCDRTAWGVEVCKQVGSPRVKLLYDIYHMQIMEGDIIRTIRQNIQYIGHFHTGGVPGRNEIDETQELNYTAIMRAIADLKYEGYVGQEFVPRREPIPSLEQAIRICDV